MLPAEYADEEEDCRDEPGQDDHHNHLADDGDDDDEDGDDDDDQDHGEDSDDDDDQDHGEEGDDKDLVSCAPCSIPGGQLHRTKPEKGNPKSIWDFRERRTNKRSRVTGYVVNSLVLIS